MFVYFSTNLLGEPMCFAVGAVLVVSFSVSRIQATRKSTAVYPAVLVEKAIGGFCDIPLLEVVRSHGAPR